MQTEKALQLNAFIVLALDTFDNFNGKATGNEPISEEIKIQFQEKCFEDRFQQFLIELKLNIVEYQEINIVKDYTMGCFMDITEWDGFNGFENQFIIANSYEIKFLLAIKQRIDNYSRKMIYCCMIKKQHKDVFCLFNIFEEEMKALHKSLEIGDEKMEDRSIESKQVDREVVAEIIENINIEPKKDDRFDFQKMKVKSDQLTTTNDKLKFIHERLYDLDQWEIQYDEQVDDPDFGTYYHLSNRYYPNFRELCRSELQRLDKISELEKKTTLKETSAVTPQAIEPSDFIWNTTDTNLLELVAALYQVNAIKLKGGTKLTRVELISYFETMFGFQIKNVEVKLTRATNRQDKTPFLDSLTLAFENYAEEKDEKIRKRK